MMRHSLWGLAARTPCPRSVSRRLAQREGVLAFTATRQAGEVAPEGRFGGGNAGSFDEFAVLDQDEDGGALVSQGHSDEGHARLGPGQLLLLTPSSALRLCSSPKVADELTADTVKPVDRGSGLLTPIMARGRSAADVLAGWRTSRHDGKD